MKIFSLIMFLILKEGWQLQRETLPLLNFIRAIQPTSVRQQTSVVFLIAAILHNFHHLNLVTSL